MNSLFTNKTFYVLFFFLDFKYIIEQEALLMTLKNINNNTALNCSELINK